MVEAPEKIWLLPAEGTLLQPGTTQQRDPWWDFDGAAWATETGKDADVEYTRSDIAERQIAELRAQVERLDRELNASQMQEAIGIERFQAAEADNARLSEALAEIAGDIDGTWDEKFRAVQSIARAALSGSGAGGWRPTHRHKKRGTEYVLVGYGRMQCDWWQITGAGHRYPVDMHEVAIYRSVDDGSLWVRPREEFEDGRFEPLPTGDHHD